MKRMQMYLKPDVEAQWELIRARPEFAYMSQEGVFVSLMHSYESNNPLKLRVELTGKEAYLRRWCFMTPEDRMANLDLFAPMVTKEMVAGYGSAKEYLDVESQKYED